MSAGETSKSYKFVDNPGDPANWSNSYTQYITEAAWRAYQLHGGPAAIGENLAEHASDDVEGLLDAYDGNDNGLIEYSWGAMTGNDADAVSFHWRHGANMDRTENAYLYSNAKAAAEAYRRRRRRRQGRRDGRLRRSTSRPQVLEPAVEPAQHADSSVSRQPAQAPHDPGEHAEPVEGDQQLLPVHGRPHAQAG